jgi:hypothetical protein
MQEGQDISAAFCARLAAVTGLGERLAQRVADSGIVTLEDAELAAYDGRLRAVPGFGAKRVAAVRAALDAELGHAPRTAPLLPRPDVATLLALDAEYRRRAAAGELPTISPRRFNPGNRAWLPVWHTERGGWTFTAMYSNTARAYRLRKRRDWVIIVYERGGDDDHCTVITAYSGPLFGCRVVRGREQECRSYYRRVVPDARAWAHEQYQLFS